MVNPFLHGVCMLRECTVYMVSVLQGHKNDSEFDF